MQQTIEEIDIPNNVFVPCPIEARYDNVRVATKCITCDHFNGLVGQKMKGPAPFVRQFLVNCGHPVPRQMLEVVL